MVGDILQPTHLLFVLVVALLVLGPKRLPEVGRTLGNGIRDFRSAINGESHETRDAIAPQPWNSDPEPEAKHEFAATSETTPATHTFAHEQPTTTASLPSPEHAPAQPAGAQPEAAPLVVSPATDVQLAAATPTDARPVEAPSQPSTTSDTAAVPGKHEFAYESSEAAENSAGPRP